MARTSCIVPEKSQTPQRMADALRLINEYLPIEFTPASASDDTAPNVRVSYDDDYLYVQPEKGTWLRVALTTWP